MVFTFNETGATLRVRGRYFNICTVYATIGDLASEVNTGSLKNTNNNMFSHSQIIGAYGDRRAAKMLILLPLKYSSSADLLRFLRR